MSFIRNGMLCLLLAGCTAVPVKPVEVVEVRVPIATPRVAPPELLACGHKAPGFKFYSPSIKSKDLVIREQDQTNFQAWIEDKNSCLRAWGAWAE